MTTMKFEITNHAAQRLKERDMADPNGLLLVLCKRSVKKIIRARCKLNGFKTQLVYWRTGKKPYHVYVTEVKDIGVYTVVTAFVV